VSAEFVSTICAGISDAFLRANGVVVCPPASLYSLSFHYFDLDGKPTGFARHRLRVAKGDQKYDQPPNSGCHAYFIPNPARVTSDVLLFLEGEKKLLASKEAGYAALGLPGLYCYTNDENEPDIPPILLPGIIDCIDRYQAKKIIFIGDTDTLVNLAFYRSAQVLADSVPNGVTVCIHPLPLGGPKGLDDVRGHLGPEAFNPWLDEQLEAAFELERNKSFIAAAILLLEQRRESIQGLTGKELDHYQHKLIRMAAEAQQSKDADRLDVLKLHKQIQKLVGCNKKEFEGLIKQEISRSNDEEIVKVRNRIAYLNAITPAEEDVPLSKLIRDGVNVILTVITTDPRLALISSLWAAFTHFYKHSYYLPLLLFTGPEKDTGKSNYMKLVAKMSYRSISILATATIHRVVKVYGDGTYAIDETPDLSQNAPLRSFVNSGYDCLSDHPVDRPILTKYNMETRELEEFESQFPKLFAGIGTFLTEDTLSRSVIIPTRRYKEEEGMKLLPYPLCDETYWLPIYRGYLRYATDARKAEFKRICLDIIRATPMNLLERRRDMFSPLLAIARMAGDGLEGELLEAIKWYFTLDRSNEKTPAARLCLRDVAKVLFRQIALHKRKETNLPTNGEEPRVLHQPTTGVYVLPSTAFTPLLIALPEGGWNKYGYSKQPITENEVWELLRTYKIHAGRIKVDGKTQRGLVYDPQASQVDNINSEGFRETYARYREEGYPTLEAAIDELRKEAGDETEDPSNAQ
jgi:hypothetical protein